MTREKWQKIGQWVFMLGMIAAIGYPQLSRYFGQKEHEFRMAEQDAMDHIGVSAWFLDCTVDNPQLLAGKTATLRLMTEGRDSIKVGPWSSVTTGLTDFARDRWASGKWRVKYRSPDGKSLFSFIEERAKGDEWVVRAIYNVTVPYGNYWDDIKNADLIGKPIGGSGSYLGARYSAD